MANKEKVSDSGASVSYFNRQDQPLLDALVKESPRGQVLIATTFLDNALRGCLLAVCKKRELTDQVRDFLVRETPEGDRGLLGSFGAKIPVCWAFGIIEQKERDALEAIHNIRNAFAHADFGISLDASRMKEGEIRNKMTGWVNVLRHWLKTVEWNAWFDLPGQKRVPGWVRDLNLAGVVVADPPSPEHVFLGATELLYVALHNIRWSIRKEEFDGAIWLVKDITYPAQSS